MRKRFEDLLDSIVETAENIDRRMDDAAASMDYSPFMAMDNFDTFMRSIADFYCETQWRYVGHSGPCQLGPESGESFMGFLDHWKWRSLYEKAQGHGSMLPTLQYAFEFIKERMKNSAIAGLLLTYFKDEDYSVVMQDAEDYGRKFHDLLPNELRKDNYGLLIIQSRFEATLMAHPKLVAKARNLGA